MTKLIGTIFILLLGLFFPTEVLSYAEWMTTDFCDRPLLQDEIIMNSKVINSDERLITIKRKTLDGKEIQLNNGDAYKAGETLELTLSEGERKGQHVFETTPNAKFSPGGCNGLRSAKTKAILTMKSDTTEPLVITAGWAEGHEEVKLAPSFTLVFSPDVSLGDTAAAAIEKDAPAIQKHEVHSPSWDVRDKSGAARLVIPSGNKVPNIGSTATAAVSEPKMDKKALEAAGEGKVMQRMTVVKDDAFTTTGDGEGKSEVDLDKQENADKVANHHHHDYDNEKKKHFDRHAYKESKSKANEYENKLTTDKTIFDHHHHHHSSDHDNPIESTTSDHNNQKDEKTTTTKTTKTVDEIQSNFLKIHPKKVHKIDPIKLKAALRGEDIYTNYFDPAITKKHSTLFYLTIYCFVFGCIVFIIYTACIAGKNGNTGKNSIKRYIRQLRGKQKGSER